ncbi:MAG: hypothetical protein G01um101419_383 [Parcubacteria group bacterium Gr01-1014_19]|nr:MAG: hypothetical protein G01um101419_383 [Parcubacteria group bacterium Gr01-1014_19]
MDIKSKLKAFLEKETQKEISDDSENLLASNILDSFSMIKIIGFVESELGIKPNMEELTPDNFNSVATISQMIEKWKSGK